MSLFDAAAQSLFATLLPSGCRLCQASIARISCLPICHDCLNRIEPIRGQVCVICGERVFTPHAEGQPICGECRTAAPLFVRAVANGSYDGDLHALIHLLKYGRVRPADGALERMLAEAIHGLGAEFISPVVVPLPLHATKLRQRGFNHAEEIPRAGVEELEPRPADHLDRVLSRRRPRVRPGSATISGSRTCAGPLW